VPSGEDGTGVLNMRQLLWSARPGMSASVIGAWGLLKGPYTIDEGERTTR
jgi:hypothetical protein